LIQSKKGFRSSVDAMLLAYFAQRHGVAPQRCVDLGAGTGLVGILLAMRFRHMRLGLIELQSPLLERASRNLQLNEVQQRTDVYHLDIGLPLPADLGSADLVVSNPPFFDPDRGVLPSHPERHQSHFETTAPVERFAKVAEQLLDGDGRLAMVYPSTQRERLVSALVDAGLQRIGIAIVHHRDPRRSPVRILVQAQRGRHTSVDELEAVHIHHEDRPDHTYAPAIERFIEKLGPIKSPRPTGPAPS
jgi:tRNA1Val (adenine37-N6)-methyltransferase